MSAKCPITDAPIDKKIEMHKSAMKMRRELKRQFMEENPELLPEDATDLVEAWLHYKGKAGLLTDMMDPQAVFVTNPHKKTEVNKSVGVYDIERTSDGYKILYFTEKESIPRVVKIRAKDGLAYNVFDDTQLTKNSYSITDLNNAYRNIDKIKQRLRIKRRKENAAARAREAKKIDPKYTVRSIKVDIASEIFNKSIDNYIDTNGDIVIDFGDGYGSSQSRFKFNKKNAEVINASLINDMSKAEDMFETLAAIDDKNLTAEHKNFLLSALRNLTDPLSKIIPDMVQFIDTHAKDTKGQVILEGKDKGLYVNASRSPWTRRNQMSAAETYVHELFHAALEYAQKNHPEILADVMNDVKDIYHQFLETVTVEDFMPDIADSINRTEELKLAQEMLDYLRNPETGMNEFIVMSQTSMFVKNVLEKRVTSKKIREKGKTLWDKMVNLVLRIYDSIYNFFRDTTGLDGYTAMSKFVNEIKAINNKSIDEINQANIVLETFGKLVEFLNKTGSTWLRYLATQIMDKPGTTGYDKLVAKFDELHQKQVNDPDSNSLWEKLQLFGLIIRFGTKTDNQAHVGAFETIISMLPFLDLKPEGSLQQLFRTFRKSDKFETIIEKVGLAAGKVEYASETTLAQMAGIISGIYGRELTQKEKISLTQGVVEVELYSLFNELLEKDEASAIKTAENVLTDDAARKQEIKNVENQIRKIEKDKKAAERMIVQSRGLGEYMITGKTSKAQMMNPYMIVGTANKDLHISNIQERNELGSIKRALVDKLSTLYAIENNDSQVNNTVASLLKENAKSTIDLMKLDASAINEFKKTEKSDDLYEMHRVKGQRFKKNANWISSKVGKKTQEEKLGVDLYKPESGLTYNDEFDVYFNKSAIDVGIRNEGTLTVNNGEQIESYVNIAKEDFIEMEDYFDLEKQKKSREKIKALLLEEQKEMVEELEKMSNPNYVPEKTGMRPVFSIDKRGELFVTDMDINIKKREVESHLKVDNGVDIVVGKTMARAISLRGAMENNKVLLDVLEADAFENFDSRRDKNLGGKTNQMEYVKIGVNEDNELSKEIWPILPRYMKEDIVARHYDNKSRDITNLLLDQDIDPSLILDDKAIKLEDKAKEIAKKPNATAQEKNSANRKYAGYVSKRIKEYVFTHKKDKNLKDLEKKIDEINSEEPYIAVRRNMVYHAFGFREASVVNWLHNTLNKKFPGMSGHPLSLKVARAVKYMDMLWKHLVKLVKSNIVIRDIPVLIWNVVSNFLLAVLQGRNPFAELKSQIDGIKFLQQYKNDYKRASELRLKKEAGIITKKEDNELLEKLQAIKKNPVMPLVNAGLYTSIAEDLSKEDLHAESYLDHQQNKMLDMLPSSVKTTLDVLFLTKNTQGFQFLLMAMQSSDFAARYSTYYNLIQKGVSKEVALKTVLDNQINYGFNHGKVLDWLNARGFVMFSMFFEKIQRVLISLVGDKPFNVLASVLAGGFMYEHSPLGDSLFERGISSVFYNPLDTALVLTEMPAVYQIMSGDY